MITKFKIFNERYEMGDVDNILDKMSDKQELTDGDNKILKDYSGDGYIVKDLLKSYRDCVWNNHDYMNQLRELDKQLKEVDELKISESEYESERERIGKEMKSSWQETSRIETELKPYLISPNTLKQITDDVKLSFDALYGELDDNTIEND